MSNTPLTSKHVLIVEDDEPSRLLFEMILTDMGWSFEVCFNGQDAVNKVAQGKFDVVLMDVRLPVMNGYQATKEIRKTHKDLPIIVVTAYKIELVEQKCFQCGASEYLTKPFDPEQLTQFLLKWTSVK